MPRKTKTTTPAPLATWTRKTVMAGNCVRVEINATLVATLAQDGEGKRFAMHGLTGTHTLEIESTDANRLWAHWCNFQEANVMRHWEDTMPASCRP